MLYTRHRQTSTQPLAGRIISLFKKLKINKNKTKQPAMNWTHPIHTQPTPYTQTKTPIYQMRWENVSAFHTKLKHTKKKLKCHKKTKYCGSWSRYSRHFCAEGYTTSLVTAILLPPIYVRPTAPPPAKGHDPKSGKGDRSVDSAGKGMRIVYFSLGPHVFSRLHPATSLWRMNNYAALNDSTRPPKKL